VTSAEVLADLGNVGLYATALLTTAAVAAYAVRGSRPGRMPWWRSPFGLHLMCFMIAFTIVIDEDALYLLGVSAGAAPFQTAWFAWLRGISFAVLIPAVLIWRLVIIIRPPGRRKP
jgi:hypothetical protein